MCSTNVQARSKWSQCLKAGRGLLSGSRTAVLLGGLQMESWRPGELQPEAGWTQGRVLEAKRTQDRVLEAKRTQDRVLEAVRI